MDGTLCGATITPRAVIYQIAQVLEYFSEDSERLLTEAALAAKDSQAANHSMQANP